MFSFLQVELNEIERENYSFYVHKTIQIEIFFLSEIEPLYLNFVHGELFFLSVKQFKIEILFIHNFHLFPVSFHLFSVSVSFIFGKFFIYFR